MTEGQYKYQALMENQRHNLEMERLGAGELETKREQARASTITAESNKMRAEKEKRREKVENFKDIAGTLYSGLSSTGSFMNQVTGAIGNVVGAIGKAFTLFA